MILGKNPYSSEKAVPAVPPHAAESQHPNMWGDHGQRQQQLELPQHHNDFQLLIWTCLLSTGKNKAKTVIFFCKISLYKLLARGTVGSVVPLSRDRADTEGWCYPGLCLFSLGCPGPKEMLLEMFSRISSWRGPGLAVPGAWGQCPQQGAVALSPQV